MAEEIDAKVGTLIARGPGYVNELLQILEGSKFKYRSTTDLKKYYLGLKKDDPIRKAIDELSKEVKDFSKVDKNVVNKVAKKYKDKADMQQDSKKAKRETTAREMKSDESKAKEQVATVEKTEIEKKVAKMMKVSPSAVHDLICKFDNTQYPLSSQKLQEYYDNLKADDPRKKALEELAKSPDCAKSVNTIYNKYKKQVEDYKKSPSTGTQKQNEGQTNSPVVSSGTRGGATSADKKIEQARELMVYMIAQFEDFEGSAYKRPGDRWTVGLGNTYKPNKDGKAVPVKPGDRIRSTQEAVDLVNWHLDTQMLDAMKKYLPIEKMSPQEIAAMASLVYQSGPGILGAGGTKSALAKSASEYFTKRTAASKNTFQRAFLNCGEKARRKAEWRVLSGEIKVVVDDKTQTAGNVVNLKKTKLGSLKEIGVPVSPDNFLSKGYVCTGDSIDNAVRGTEGAHRVQARSQPAPSKSRGK